MKPIGSSATSSQRDLGRGFIGRLIPQGKPHDAVWNPPELHMDEYPHPIPRLDGVPLASDIFCEKDIARSEGFHGAAADADLHRPSKRNAPLAPGRIVVAVQILADRIVLKDQGFGGEGRQEMARGLTLIKILEMRLAVIARVQSAKKHGTSLT